MRTNRLIQLTTLFFGFTALATTGCAENDKKADAALPPDKTAAPAAPTPPPPDTGTADWSDIKGCTYDQRDKFFAGLKNLEARVDGQIAELAAKRATMRGVTRTQEWDFAMKEMTDARAYLKSTGEVLAKTAAPSWTEQQDRVGQAWVRTQDAFAKVKASTTN